MKINTQKMASLVSKFSKILIYDDKQDNIMELHSYDIRNKYLVSFFNFINFLKNIYLAPFFNCTNFKKNIYLVLFSNFVSP